MNKKLLWLLMFTFVACQSQPCSNLSQSFKSFDQALSLVESHSFKIKESVNTVKSSWIRCAKYYSCDEKRGFFVLCTDKENYIHQNMPIEIWSGFKNADSFGSYYNQFIKKKFRLKISGQQ